MFDRLFNEKENSMLKSSIKTCQAMVKYDEQFIKRSRKSIKENMNTLNEFTSRNVEEWYVERVKNLIRRNEDGIKRHEITLKDNKAMLAKLQIEKFVFSGNKFTVIQGGIS